MFILWVIQQRQTQNGLFRWKPHSLYAIYCYSNGIYGSLNVMVNNQYCGRNQLIFSGISSDCELVNGTMIVIVNTSFLCVAISTNPLLTALVSDPSMENILWRKYRCCKGDDTGSLTANILYPLLLLPKERCKQDKNRLFVGNRPLLLEGFLSWRRGVGSGWDKVGLSGPFSVPRFSIDFTFHWSPGPPFSSG